MRRSLDTSAHVTSAIEVDMSKVVAIRAKLKKQFQDDYGINPTYLSFVSRAVVETLRDYPWINGEIRGDQIVTRKYVNLGFAVELADGKGLIVPVVKNAEGLNLLGIARAVTAIAPRFRAARGPPPPPPTPRGAPATRSSCRTTCRAARSRSRTPAATGRSTARR